MPHKSIAMNLFTGSYLRSVLRDLEKPYFFKDLKVRVQNVIQ